MFGLRGIVLAAIGVFGAGFTGAWGRDLAGRRGATPDPAARLGWPSPLHLGIGFLTDFLDTFSVGSFATTTALYRLFRQVPDTLIPGTLLIGHTFATLAEAFIFIGAIRVDLTTLVLLVVTAALGAWLGAGVVSRLPRRKVLVGMGAALLLASGLMLAGLLNWLPPGGATVGLSGIRLVVAMTGSFVIGALMTIGIGNFGPSLIFYGLLGMDTKAIFPVMMGSAAVLMSVAGIKFMKRASYAPRPALGLALGGVPGVLVAYYVVKSLSTQALRWLVLVVVVYTAASMLRSALRDEQAATPPEAA
jgi:hypothetical protein